MELEDAVEELEPLSFLLGRLLDQLCARLAARSLAACAIRVRFDLEPAFTDPLQKSAPKIYEKVLSLPVPMRDSKMLLKLLRLQLQAEPPSAPILKIVLAADPARPRVSQGELFLPSVPDPEKLELTIARLANLVGDSQYRFARIDGHASARRISHVPICRSVAARGKSTAMTRC